MDYWLVGCELMRGFLRLSARRRIPWELAYRRRTSKAMTTNVCLVCCGKQGGMLPCFKDPIPIWSALLASFLVPRTPMASWIFLPPNYLPTSGVIRIPISTTLYWQVQLRRSSHFSIS